MMRKRVSRTLAAALCLIMALSLFVPALAATPMGGEAAEVPVETDPILSVGGAVTPAVADDEPAGLAAACCTATTPHADGATIEYPTGGTEHYCAASNGDDYARFVISLVGEAVGSSMSKTSNVSKDGSDGHYKHKIVNGGTATVTLKEKSGKGVNATINLHMVDPNAHTHTWDDGKVTTPATCGETGVMTYTCIASGCSNPAATRTEDIPASGEHTWSDTYDTITEPTCTATGLAGKVCSVCHAVSSDAGNTKPLDMVPHTYKNGTDGICLVCNYDSSTQGTHVHTWTKGADTDADGWKVTTQPTCQAAGTKQRTCSTAACGKVEHGTVAKLPHSFTGAGGACVNGCGQTQTEVAGNMAAEGGWLESAFIEWPVQSGVARYEVYVKEATAANYPDTPIDDQLIRRYPGDLMRADALGLVGNKSYKMKVVAYDSADKELPAMTLESGQLEVKPHIREGYAFWSGSTLKTGSGAYNEDGSLKSNAVVVYVDNSNFDKVPVTVGSASFTGIQELVDGSGASKLAPGIPVCIRILGTIDTTGFPSGSWGSSSEGLQVKGGSAYTNKNMTIEGVGNDAALHGFGILLRNCGNVEIRNIGILNCVDDSISIDTDNCNLWVHNVDFFYGQDGGGDKAKGDGALDTKGSKQITHSFNHFWDNGKCNLQGMKSEDPENTITYHHNWYDHADSRLPRVRTGTVHVYNNYYDGNAKYGAGSTMGSSVFVENNYFRNCKHPMLTSLQGTDTRFGTDMSDAPTFSGEAGGVIKAFGNTIIGGEVTANGISVAYYDANSELYSVEYDAYLAKSRDETVPASVKSKSGSNTYNNFDTADDFYSYIVQSPADAKNTVTQYAGRVQGGDFKWTFDNATEDANYAIIPGLRKAVTEYNGTLVSIGGHVEGGTSSGPVAVSKVTLNTTSLTLKPGATMQLFANVIPSTAADKAVSWKSSAAGVATVSDDGLVTAVANGTATVTVTTDDGGKTATCAVTVSDGTGGGEGGGDIGGGDTPTGTTHTLDATKFTMTNPVAGSSKKPTVLNKEAVTATEISDKTGGYFTSVGTVNKRTKDGYVDAVEWLDLDKSGTSGISFKVTNAPAEIKINWGSTGGGQTSNLVIKDGSGTVVKNETLTDSKSSTRTDTTYTVTTAGTYTVASAEGAGYSVRLYNLTVTEAAGGQPGPGDEPLESDVLESTTTTTKLHYTVAANGAVSVTEAVPAENLVFATYWNGDRFLGAKTVTQSAATTALSGWTSIKLIWIDAKDAPQCLAKTINKP